MKNKDNSLPQKRITIKREANRINPVSNKYSQIYFNGEDKTIHVRRHSVVVCNARYGATQRVK
jgi:hypothetical protein